MRPQLPRQARGRKTLHGKTSGRFRNLPVVDDSGVISMAGITACAGRCWISAFPVRVASAVAHAAREVQGAGDRRVFPACAGCGRDPPKVAVIAVRAQRIRVAAVSG
jgi:hypothetical protein